MDEQQKQSKLNLPKGSSKKELEIELEKIARLLLDQYRKIKEESIQ